MSGGWNFDAVPTASATSISLFQISVIEAPDGAALNARRMLCPGISLAAGSRQFDFRGDIDHTMPSAPDEFADETERKPPGMPPGAAVFPDAAEMALDWAIG